MKRWVHASVRIVDKDEYNVQQYLPKKSLPLIDEITMEPDFDNRRNRTVNFYTVYFKDGDRVSGVGLADLIQKVKSYMLNKATNGGEQ